MKLISKNIWQIPREGKMRVPAFIVASDKIAKHIELGAIEQLKNVATLPGIVKGAFAMPDIHQGYGFPIGGVAAFDINNGIVSPGGVGYDINCGVRILTSNITHNEIKPFLNKILSHIYSNVPCGIGSKGKISVSRKDLKEILENGINWAIKSGFGEKRDIESIEDMGKINGANPDLISERAIERGLPQVGSLGAGNHFIEIQVVKEIFNKNIADEFGIKKNNVTIMIHTGSRGLGYQVCDDAIRQLRQSNLKYNIDLPDKELISAPIDSKEGKRYLSQMAAAANYAFVNRQLITHWIREIFHTVLSEEECLSDLNLLYDICHNIAKFEKYNIDTKLKTVLIHRKGATRALGPFNELLPDIYKKTGQPIIIPGDMGRSSYILVGTKNAENMTFSSTCHGSGRVLSRHKAIKATKGIDLQKTLEESGIKVMAKSWKTLHEEASIAYKDISDVIDSVDGAGICQKVAKLIPIGVIKG